MINTSNLQDADLDPSSPPTPLDHSNLETLDLERLGRQRPETFPTAISEILFCSSMLVSMLMSVSEPASRFLPYLRDLVMNMY